METPPRKTLSDTLLGLAACVLVFLLFPLLAAFYMFCWGVAGAAWNFAASAWGG
ncbi:MAG: hypothetical protein KY445_13025 [Armatimonadetes bacterium]|nr:hypothetical protein [Armatimonadota bacterium]